MIDKYEGQQKDIKYQIVAKNQEILNMTESIGYLQLENERY